MEKIWLQHYPEGVPATIDPEAFSSVVDVFNKSVEKFGHLPAYSNLDFELTYADVDQQSRAFAAYLQNQTSLKPGDRIAIQMPNCLQYPIALFGALRAGLVVVNTNPLYTPREMAHQFKDSGAKALVVVSLFAEKVQQILGDTDIQYTFITNLGDMLPWPKRDIVNFVVKNVKKMVPSYSLPQAISFRNALKQGAGLTYQQPEIKINDLAFLQYTGGTTGVSKGGMLTHRNVVANMEQIRACINTELEEGKEIIITALPMYHIFALTVNTLAFMSIGGKGILITNPRDIPAFVKELKKHPFTVMTGVNTLFNALLNNPDFKNLDFSSLRFSVGGAMAMQQAVVDKWRQVTKTTIIEGYGLTEASPVVTVNPVNGQERIGTIGMPVPSTDVMLVDEDGNEVTDKESAGEICVKGPQVMQGYWNRPEETDKVLKEGWLRTGDMAVWLDQGFLKIVDRKKDMILVSGFNVYPNEVEDVIALHPAVTEVACVGIPDKRSGEAVKIFVVRQDESLTAEELIEFARKNLTGYKVPHHVEFRNELPKTNVGKILRRSLREEEMAKHKAADAQ